MTPLQHTAISILAGQLPATMQQIVRDRLNEDSRQASIFKVMGKNGTLEATCHTIEYIASNATPEAILAKLDHLVATENDMGIVKDALRAEFNRQIVDFLEKHPIISVTQVEKTAGIPVTTIAAASGKNGRPIPYKHLTPVLLVLNNYGMEL